MKKAALLLMLAACGNQHAGTKPDPEAAEPAATPVDLEIYRDLKPPPPPVATGPTFAQIVNASTVVEGKQIDATSLGDVTVHLVARMGAAVEHDGRTGGRIERSLVLFGSSGMRLELASTEMPLGEPWAFGTVIAEDAFVDPLYVGEQHGFAAAPPWTATGKVVAATTDVDFAGDELGYVVTDEGGKLVVWFAEAVHGESPPDHWRRRSTITLSNGAAVTVGSGQVDEPALGDPVRVVVREDEVATHGKRRDFALSLAVGDLVGPLAEVQSVEADVADWSKDVDVTIPGADELLASREYVNGQARTAFVVGRREGALVVWRRDQLEWVELAHVPLPGGAKLDVRVPIHIRPKKIKAIETVQPEKRVEKEVVEEPWDDYGYEAGDPNGGEGGVAGGEIGGVVSAPPPPPPPPPPPGS